ncbi:MAG TPA: SRPBCC domain-containing protein [Trichocoleus sp.]
MAKELSTSIEINAPADKVWAALTDFSRYSEWNPFILSAEGVPQQGKQITVFIQPPGGTGMKFRPVIQALQPNQELRWLGRLLLPGIFDGEHQFRLEPLADNCTRFIHREVFRGLLVPLLWRDLDTKARKGFEDMNQALKQLVEA